MKRIIFDLGAVIINLKKELDWWNEDMLPNFDNGKLLDLFKQKFFHDFETGVVSVERFLDTMQSIKTNSDISVETAWNGILQDIPHHRIELLQRLKQDNHLYLLSNTNHIHLRHIINNLEKTYHKNIFDDLFDIQFYSQNMGMRKPNAEIYRHVQQTIGETSVGDFIFLDDKPDNLIEPKKSGWDTVLVDKDIGLIFRD